MKAKDIVLETTTRVVFITEAAPVKEVRVCLDYITFTYVGGFREVLKRSDEYTALHIATRR